MNVKAHMSAQSVPNQLTQQNGNLPPQMQSVGTTPAATNLNTSNMEQEHQSARISMKRRIFSILLHRHRQPITEAQGKRFGTIVQRLEDGLFRTANTMEDYMNLDTLEIRLQNLIKPGSMNRGQHFPQHVNSSPAIGTMIPTPGMLHNGSSNSVMTSSMDTSMISGGGCNTMAPSNVNAGNLLPAGTLIGTNGGSFNTSDGGNVSAMSVQRPTSQMIPTPGFNSSNNQSYVNLDSYNNGGGFTIAEPTVVSHPHQQKQHVGLNSRTLQNLSSPIGGGIRSSLQQNSYGFSNGALNGGLGTISSSIPHGNGTGASEGYLTSVPYGSSAKPLEQHFDQNQQQAMHGDGYGFDKADPSGSGNFYGTAKSVGSMNTHNFNSASLQAMSKSSSSSMLNQSNFHGTQHTSSIKIESVDQPKSSLCSRENFLQSHQQEQPHLFQKQHKQKQQNQLGFGEAPVISDLRNQVKPELAMEHYNEAMHSQLSEQDKLSELQNQFQHHSAEDLTRSAQSLSLLSDQHVNKQLLQPHQLASESQNDTICFSMKGQSQPVLEGQWSSRSQDTAHIPQSMSQMQHVQEDFHQRISGQDEAQRNNLSSSEESVIGQGVASRSTTDPPNSRVVMHRSEKANRECRNQQRWLLFLWHARKCKAPEGKCQDVHCVTVQKLLRHMDTCKLSQCSYVRCYHSKRLIRHHMSCKDTSCPVCIPVKNFLHAHHLKARIRSESSSGIPSSFNGGCKLNDAEVSHARTMSKIPVVVETSEDLQPSVKRMKLEQPSQFVIGSDISSQPVYVNNELSSHKDVHGRKYQYDEMCEPVKSEIPEVKMEDLVSSGDGDPNVSEIKMDTMGGNQRADSESAVFYKSTSVCVGKSIKGEKEIDPSKQETMTLPAENSTGTKSGKPKIKGVSLTELFTPEQVREHIVGLRQWVGQSKVKAEKNQAMEHSMSENSCQLCAVEKLAFEPPPIYCTPCGSRIKRTAMYYTVGAGDTRHFCCIPCYNETRGDSITLDGTSIPKGRLEKKKNDEETEEWWVQCDKCEAWQHQICALFNGRRNDGGQAEYTCPNCYIDEVEKGERSPLPQSAVLGAKDLPRTILSDHIEQRLFKKLNKERQDRARSQGKSFDEVPGAEALVVRVVSSVDKKLEVKQRFLEIFQEENYPIGFAYKSKVVLLFQKIEGVEVCLFGMYVQEFGSECQVPNQRRVYLSYLDSVKYFRPEIKTVTGEALRTFVYHEILIGYLEYCKKRGFTSCYIWACPPLKGEDYILYCHPEIQKTPKSDKLREWYLSMLRKASKENIVVGLTNLYDHFFVSNGECKAKVTAARLPYFDGDYWPGAAEDLIAQFQQEEEDRKHNKKGTIKKVITKRALKASGQSDLSGNASKDLLLMRKLGDTIYPMKEDFIMVHLQHACTHCCMLMVSRNRWVCRQCKSFQLCDKCYEAEQKLEERERHPINQREKHFLYQVEIDDVPVDTKDKDEILESEFFDTRQAFLSLCQGNHYQYDTLRRAKHSSMMVLYHLHNPTAPAFVITCNICHLDIEAGQGWRCEVCTDFDVCSACYQKDGGIDHPHKLTNHAYFADRDAQNKEARELRVLQLRKMLDLLVHASQCRSSHCQYPNCRKVKGLFRHGIQCKIRASGGCVLCKKMWYLLQLHSRACKESECNVPRCRDLKDHLKRQQQQAESRRRAAVMEMMRNRAAEVAGNA